MPLTEAQIINATEAFIDRNHLSHFTFTLRDLFPKPTLSVLLAYEEEMRRLHEVAEAPQPKSKCKYCNGSGCRKCDGYGAASPATPVCLCPNGHGQMQLRYSPLAPSGPVGTSWKCATCGIERMWPD